MNADSTRIKDTLVGVWAVDAGGLQSQLILSPDDTYSNVLAGGMQGHSGTWAVTNNAVGGQTLLFTLKKAFPESYVGPLGSVPIVWPESETWYITSIQPDHVVIHGGELQRIQPGTAGAAPWLGVGAQGVPFAGGMTAADFNAEAEKEMRQLADAGRKVAGSFKSIWSAFKKH